ncbi:hypothetical protein [Agarilytica rhodophyticola]|uniref:hypothetical protein n=1 Tax=Agarilytica rhodophyticola TaxID=1737490 RepID=UPI0013152E37|nr:hypothetical protein [Agarilytica rhodophyticola]
MRERHNDYHHSHSTQSVFPSTHNSLTQSQPSSIALRLRLKPSPTKASASSSSRMSRSTQIGKQIFDKYSPSQFTSLRNDQKSYLRSYYDYMKWPHHSSLEIKRLVKRDSSEVEDLLGQKRQHLSRKESAKLSRLASGRDSYNSYLSKTKTTFTLRERQYAREYLISKGKDIPSVFAKERYTRDDATAKPAAYDSADSRRQASYRYEARKAAERSTDSAKRAKLNDPNWWAYLQ